MEGPFFLIGGRVELQGCQGEVSHRRGTLRVCHISPFIPLLFHARNSLSRMLFVGILFLTWFGTYHFLPNHEPAIKM